MQWMLAAQMSKLMPDNRRLFSRWEISDEFW
jgi:hypothetical protein